MKIFVSPDQLEQVGRECERLGMSLVAGDGFLTTKPVGRAMIDKIMKMKGVMGYKLGRGEKFPYCTHSGERVITRKGKRVTVSIAEVGF